MTPDQEYEALKREILGRRAVDMPEAHAVLVGLEVTRRRIKMSLWSVAMGGFAMGFMLGWALR